MPLTDCQRKLESRFHAFPSPLTVYSGAGAELCWIPFPPASEGRFVTVQPSHSTEIYTEIWKIRIEKQEYPSSPSLSHSVTSPTEVYKTAMRLCLQDMRLQSAIPMGMPIKRCVTAATSALFAHVAATHPLCFALGDGSKERPGQWEGAGGGFVSDCSRKKQETKKAKHILKGKAFFFCISKARTVQQWSCPR